MIWQSLDDEAHKAARAYAKAVAAYAAAQYGQENRELLSVMVEIKEAQMKAARKVAADYFANYVNP
jgi:hypothetical protein